MSPATARRLTAEFTGTLLALTVHPAPRTAAAEVTATPLTG